MHRTQAVGAATAVLALAAYLVGVSVAYPGRAFSITLLMVGITLYAIGGEE